MERRVTPLGNRIGPVGVMTPAVEAATSFLKTAGVLLGLWVVLFVVGLALRVIPPESGWLPGSATSEETDADPEVADALDAEVLLDAGASEETLAPDAGVVLVEVTPAVSPAASVATHALCPEPASAPSLAVLAVLGDARPEIVVGCGGEWQVLAFGSDALPGRVARIVTPAGNAGLSPFAGAPASLDFDADGHADLALPFVRFGAGGATSGGGLYVLRASGWNVLGEVRALAPIATAAVASGAIDANAGDDLVAVNQANPFARLPSEGWSFLGGASPRRSAVLRTGTGARAVVTLDMDLDGFLDVAIASTDDGRVDLFFGDGTGTFPRRRSLDVASAAGLAVGDLDGDGRADLIIEGATPSLVIAGPEAGLALVPLADAGALRGLEAMDLDGDGKAEIVGFLPPRLVSLHRTEAGTYEAQTLIELADPSFGVRRQLLVDLNGDGAREIVILGTRTEGTERALELAIIASTERGLLALEAGAPIADAPWVVEVPLPEAQPL